MRTAVLALVVALAGVLASEPAEAHGRTRFSVGMHFGAPLFWGPWWYYPPPPYYYYPPATVVVPAQPVTYIEKSQPQPAQGQAGWWYYCDTSRGYYPYVKECPAGWQRVPPSPPDAK